MVVSRWSAMVGNKERPIPDSAVCKPIAEYLRLLRYLAGNPSYRTLEPIAGVKHNALSQLANGRRLIGADSVRLYVSTIVRYATQHGIDLHAKLRGYANENPDFASTYKIDLDHPLIDQALGIHARTIGRRKFDAVEALTDRSPVTEENLLDRRLLERINAGRGQPSRADHDANAGPSATPRSLGEVETMDELIGVIRELIQRHGWNTTVPRHGETAVEAPAYLYSEEAQDTIARGAPMTSRVYGRILEACGAGVIDGDQFHPIDPAWAAAWERVTGHRVPAQRDPVIDAIATPERLPEPSGRWSNVKRWARWWKHRLLGLTSPPPQHPLDHDADETGTSGAT